jgi:hypothetical protein
MNIAEEFEDTKRINRICKSKDRQHNGKRTKKNDIKTVHRKLKMEYNINCNNHYIFK